jgi:type I restriction enzyme M protein
VQKGYIKGIIGLPANLFYGTGIPACIIVIDKENAHSRKGIFMIDASASFMKDGPKNRLRARDIHKIVDVFTKQTAVPKYSRTVSLEEIEKNDFNLNLPRYIDSQQAEDLQDIDGHLHGGVPCADVDAFQRYWDVCQQLREALFREMRPGYLELAVDKSAVKSAIYEHPEFAAFIAGMNIHFAEWRDRSSARLKLLEAENHPRKVIAELSEDLLVHYAGKPLINHYDVYQHLMDYWTGTMQDDCYMISADGWKARTYRIMEKDKKGREKDKGWTCDLVPKELIVARYFAGEQELIDRLTAKLESVAAGKTELEEEHGGDEGAFSEIEKVNRAGVTARLKEIKGDSEAAEEAAVLNEWLKLSGDEATLKKKLKDAEASLDSRVYAYYPELTEDDVRSLVVDDKWLSALDAAIHGEMDRISQSLTRRVKELAERYETPLPEMAGHVADLEAKVNAHLERMGFKV